MYVLWTLHHGNRGLPNVSIQALTNHSTWQSQPFSMQIQGQQLGQTLLLSVKLKFIFHSALRSSSFTNILSVFQKLPSQFRCLSLQSKRGAPLFFWAYSASYLSLPYIIKHGQWAVSESELGVVTSLSSSILDRICFDTIMSVTNAAPHWWGNGVWKACGWNMFDMFLLCALVAGRTKWRNEFSLCAKFPNDGTVITHCQLY